MNCAESREFVDQALDRRTFPASHELDIHLAACPSCRDDHSGIILLLLAIDAWRRQVPEISANSGDATRPQ